jgi:hypothetical protein
MLGFLERLFTKAQNKAAEMSVRGVLAMSVKIPITKLLKMAILHLKLLLLLSYGCCYVEATKRFLYLRDYEVRSERKHKTAMKTEQEGCLKVVCISC